MARVSEYQYYEFLAIDRPLTAEQRSQLREQSTRAEITATRFTNEYQWGDFKGDPTALMRQYFDAHLYFANWGTRRLMFRVPRGALDAEVAYQYVYGDTAATIVATREHLIIDLYADREPDDDWEQSPSLGPMVDARAGLISGDLRLLYLAWLFAIQWEEIEDEDTEPPVPAGLDDLSASLRAVADFLEIDEDLIAAAALASPDREDDDPGALAEWIAALPARQKDTLLERVASGDSAQVQVQLLRRFRESRADKPGTAAPAARTAKQLWAAAGVLKTERERAAAERERAERARRETEKAAAYAKHLDDLSAREASAWQRAVTLIEAKNQRDYELAVTMLSALRDLAERDGRLDVFNGRIHDLRGQHRRKTSLMERFDAAGLPG